jgi:hypothetical protein
MGWFGKPSGPSGPFVDGDEVSVAGVAVAIGEPIEAPLSGKPCLCWTTRVGVPAKQAEDDVRLQAFRVGLALAGPLSGGGGRVHLGGKRSRPPLAWMRRQAGMRMALDTHRGRLVIDPDLAAIDGPPMVLIPRKLDREHALIAAWGLRDALPANGMVHVVFEEVIVGAGQTIDVVGVVRTDGEVMRVEQTRLKTRR